MSTVTSRWRRVGRAAFLAATLVPVPTGVEEIASGGCTSTVRSGRGGPGPSAWDAKNVWLDAATNLHLKTGLKQVSKAFPFVLAGDEATHRFAWHRDQVVLQSLNGHRDDDDQPLAGWTYSPPEPARWIAQRLMPVQINLWLFQRRPPKDGQEVEVIIRDFKYTPDESEHVSSVAAADVACPLKHGQWEPFPPVITRTRRPS